LLLRISSLPASGAMVKLPLRFILHGGDRSGVKDSTRNEVMEYVKCMDSLIAMTPCMISVI
jgi:hypothetical protein